jgi:hypothetical protein
MEEDKKRLRNLEAKLIECVLAKSNGKYNYCVEKNYKDYKKCKYLKGEYCEKK